MVTTHDSTLSRTAVRTPHRAHRGLLDPGGAARPGLCAVGRRRTPEGRRPRPAILCKLRVQNPNDAPLESTASTSRLKCAATVRDWPQRRRRHRTSLRRSGVVRADHRVGVAIDASGDRHFHEQPSQPHRLGAEGENRRSRLRLRAVRVQGRTDDSERGSGNRKLTGWINRFSPSRPHP